MVALRGQHLGNLLDAGQRQRERRLGDGEVVQAAAVGDGHRRGEPGGEHPVGAGGQGLHPAQPGRVGGELGHRGRRPSLHDGAVGVQMLGGDRLAFVDGDDLDAGGGLELERGIVGGENLHMPTLPVTHVARGDVPTYAYLRDRNLRFVK